MEDRPVGKEYAGPSGIGRDSIWLTAEDLIEGKDVAVTIAGVIHYPIVKFQGGRVRTNLLAIRFVDKERELGLNATNRKALNSMFGNIAKSWKGQKVTLYVGETQMAGETVKCVRIRNKGSRAVSAVEDLIAENDPKAGPLGVEVGATPTEGAAAFEATRKIADEACAEFNGERPFLEMRPAASGEWYLIDKELAKEPEHIYSAQRAQLICTRERLAEIYSAIAHAAGIIA